MTYPSGMGMPVEPVREIDHAPNLRAHAKIAKASF